MFTSKLAEQLDFVKKCTGTHPTLFLSSNRQLNTEMEVLAGSWETEDITETLFYGGESLHEVLSQFVKANAGRTQFDLVILLTGQTSADLFTLTPESNQQPTVFKALNSSPVFVVGLAETQAPVDDIMAEELAASGGGLAHSIPEAYRSWHHRAAMGRLGSGMGAHVVESDGLLFVIRQLETKQGEAPKSRNVNEEAIRRIAARQLLTVLARNSSGTEAETLRQHAIALESNMVTEHTSSVIAVTEQPAGYQEQTERFQEHTEQPDREFHRVTETRNIRGEYEMRERMGGGTSQGTEQLLSVSSTAVQKSSEAMLKDESQDDAQDEEDSVEDDDWEDFTLPVGDDAEESGG
mmetsp:Transcript_920/g.2214  ORF Transcript_920/g.2214 Transcript_920/m.2214 type:complete len:351 (-) Transcript_920:6-1058(-)